MGEWSSTLPDGDCTLAKLYAVIMSACAWLVMEPGPYLFQSKVSFLLYRFSGNVAHTTPTTSGSAVEYSWPVTG